MRLEALSAAVMVLPGMIAPDRRGRPDPANLAKDDLIEGALNMVANCKTIFLAALATGCSLIGVPAAARDWYVSAGGSDARDGRSAATAFKTLQKADSVVSPGDVVLIGNGIYEGDPSATKPGSALLAITKSGRPNAWITWKARPGERPELRPREWAGIKIKASYIVVEGLTLIGANDEISLIEAIAAAKVTPKTSRFNTNGIFVDGRECPPDAKPHHVIIRGNIIGKMPGGGIGGMEADHITVEDNKVFENAWYMEYAGSGITFLNNWAFDDAPGYHFVIQRNMVWNNRTLVPWGKTGKLSDGNGILLDVSDQAVTGGATNPNGDAVVAAEAKPDEPPKRPIWKARSLIANNLSAFNGGSGIHTFRTSHVDIINNTTYWNGSSVNYEELFANRSDDVVILNNIIVPRPGGRVTSNNRNTNLRWDYNLYPAAQNVVSGPNDIVADPRFVAVDRDLLRADFRVTKDSAAVGSATDELAQPTDLRGTKRPIGRRDRGAFEQ